MKDHHNSDEAYTVIISPRFLTGAWLKKNPQTASFKLVSLQHKRMNHLELEKLILFNPTKIGTLIAGWYKNCQKQMPLLCALHGPSLQEQVLLLHTAHPQASHLPISHAPEWQWQHTYLYSADHRHCFYICGIQKTIVFQYQLLAINQHLPLSLLTTERMALTHCYRHLFGSAYRPAQLAQSMHAHNNRIEQIFFKEDLARLLSIPSHITITDELRLPLLTACGLFVMQGINNEKH